MYLLIHILTFGAGLVIACLLNQNSPKLSAMYAFQSGFFLMLIFATITEKLI